MNLTESQMDKITDAYATAPYHSLEETDTLQIQ
jgi:hypothetical protein